MLQLLAMVSPVPLAMAGPDAPTQRLDRAIAVLIEARDTANPQLCRDLRAEFIADPPPDWSQLAAVVWNGVATCEWHPNGLWHKTTPGVDDIRRAWEASFQHFRRMPAEQRLKNDFGVDLFMLYGVLLRSFHSPELVAVADAEEAEVLDDWYRRAAGPSPDPLAVASLSRLGGAVYGKRWLAAWMLVQQQRLERVLGPGHPATLHMLRSRVFAARAHDRPAEALALSDDYAARAARWQPDDERLAMLNRSERIGALSALGRSADAMDEGQLLLAWLQGQRPLPAASIMRAGYNLAGVALQTGDIDAAERFARVSLEHGLQADAQSRGEIIVPRWQLLLARLQRGDDHAGPELMALVQGVVSWDLGAIEALYGLHQWAVRRADADTEALAWQLISRVTIDHSTSLQGTRALPLVLQAGALPAGGEDGLAAASSAWAVGLASDSRVHELRPALALARHVAPQQPTGAAWLCKRGAQALADWRQGLPEQQADTQRAWLADHEQALRQCVGLLIDQGRLGEAEQVMGVVRDEELIDFRRRSRGAARRDAQVPTLGFTADERQRNVQVDAWQVRLRQEAAAARARADAQPDQRQRRGGFDAQAEQLSTQAAQGLRELAFRAPPVAAPGDRTVKSAQTVRVRAVPGHARVTYVLSPQADSYAWALVESGGRAQRLKLPATTAQLGREVAALRAAVSQAGDATLPAAAQRLHQWLLAPLQGALQGARQLNVVPDGVLRYLPFAALHDGRRYLVERVQLNLVLQTDGPAPAGAPRPSGAEVAPGVVAFGRTLPSATHSALPGVQVELAALQRLPRGDVDVALDGAFTRSRLTQALQRRPQVVHLASHFVLAPASEEDSYLLLGDGERLSLRELRQLPWQGVRLALLSACESALPLDHDGAAQGREWAGFAAALQRAGVADVLATLWRIDDESAARWMDSFYQQWSSLRRGAPPDAAVLARVQRQWLHANRGSALAHPRHWAGFVWIGR